MPLTRDFRETVNTRVKQDASFKTALLIEALFLSLNGESETAQLILRDLVYAQQNEEPSPRTLL
jgi:hypothetical protein